MQVLWYHRDRSLGVTGLNSRREESAVNKPTDLILPHGGYRKLSSFVVALAVYDGTVIFCNRSDRS
jgi:hypothetical protein